MQKELNELFVEVNNDHKPYYHFVMVENEGCEGYKVVRKESEILPRTLNSMELRARMNSHRNISVWAFKASRKIPAIDISLRKIAKNKNAIRMF